MIDNIRMMYRVTPRYDVCIMAAEFIERAYHVLELFYKYKHGKLPGSLRTYRLQKKRRRTVLRWFMKEKRRIGVEKMMERFANVALH